MDNKKIKVVHITTVHPQFDQRIFHRECVSLAKKYNIILLSCGQDEGYHSGVLLKSIGIKTHDRIGINLFDRIRKSLKAFNIAKQLKADFYHFHDPELIPIGIALKLLLRTKIIYDCHEDNIGFAKQKIYLAPFVKILISNLLYIVEKIAAIYFDAIITADEGVSSRFKENNNITEIIFNFPRLDIFNIQGNNNTKKVDLIYHGSLPKYHMENCFKIDEELIKLNYHATWLFFGNITCLDWALDQIRKRRAETRFILGGRIPHEDVPEMIMTGKVGIIPLPNLPKFQHNIPTKLFEFMSVGMPVILSNLPPSRAFVENSKCAIMISPTNYKAYAYAIYILLKSPCLRDKMGSIGKALVHSKYNWDVEIKKLFKLYDRVYGL